MSKLQTIILVFLIILFFLIVSGPENERVTRYWKKNQTQIGYIALTVAFCLAILGTSQAAARDYLQKDLEKKRKIVSDQNGKQLNEKIESQKKLNGPEKRIVANSWVFAVTCTALAYIFIWYVVIPFIST
jgi:hypothetical protein